MWSLIVNFSGKPLMQNSHQEPHALLQEPHALLQYPCNYSFIFLFYSNVIYYLPFPTLDCELLVRGLSLNLQKMNDI